MESEAWDFFEDILPPEVAEIVFSFLSLEDIVYVSLVCKTWNNYFDTKDIWRKIIEHYYGEISPRSVDLSQPFRWKRTFIILHNAHSWAKTLKNTTMTYKSSYDTPERATMGASGQFIHTPTSWISIKMAGKLVQVKRDPLTIDDKKWIPTSTGAVDLPILASHNGKYLIAKDYYRRYFLYDGEKLASMDVGDYSATQLQISYGTGIYRHLPSISFPNASFNSRFVVMANRTLYNASGGDVYHAVFDLKSECGCIQPQYKDAQKNRFHIIKHLQCNEYAINTKYGARGLFVSQEVLDLFVFFVNELDEEKSNASYSRYVFYPKMVIWKHGKGWQEEKTVHFKKCALVTDITNISEHIIDEHHWICFDMGNVYETRIIDLNNTSNQFKLDQISQRLWIPKKNKLILASGTKITVFDLTLKRWTSRITCQSDVRAMTLSKTARILFVADNRFVHAYHWETGKLVGSVSHWQHHSYPVIETIHIGYDQVIILNGKLFLKMPAKCDM